jgi:hypothetical protein
MSEENIVQLRSHLCRSNVKKTTLEIAAYRINGYGIPRFTRVSKAFLSRIEVAVIAAIRREVQLHPSKGKTLL